MTDIRAFQQVLIKVSKRLDKLESQMIELQGYVGYLKDNELKQSKKKNKKEEAKKLKKMEYDTIKTHMGDLI